MISQNVCHHDTTKLSTACHSQTDRQMERVNQVLQQYLWCMISYKKDYWLKFFPMIEFAYKNTLHASTSITPFTKYGFHPHFSYAVWLLHRHILTTRPCNKLDYNTLGPFCIVEKVNLVAFHLALPSHYRIHNVFYASLLELYHPSSISGRIIEPPYAHVWEKEVGVLLTKVHLSQL